MGQSILPAFLIGVLLLGIGSYLLLFEIPSTVLFHIGGIVAMIGLFPFGMAMKQIME
ncbi:MAG: hypothetical protein M1368_06210 [Thaumarchaeota archaeon]|nr:hypothetical protein [Nitrososphaerota archaeon]